MDHFAGLDVSVKETSVCIVDDTGRIVREVKVASEPDALLAVLTNPAYRFKRIGLEAGPLSQWLFSALAEAGLPVTDLRTLAATIKARWVCEQAHQQLKEELGLDHFEGRSWQGLHRHALMTMIAYAFLQHRRLTKGRREKRINGPPPQPSLPAVRRAIVDLIVRLPPQQCLYCRRWIVKRQPRE